MLLHFVYLFIFLLNCVKCDEFSESIWRDMKNNTIQVSEYCKNKNCIVKCCPEGQFMAPTSNGTKCVTPKSNIVKRLINYSDIKVYRWSEPRSELTNTNTRLQSEFTFIQNNILSNATKTITFTWCDVNILEDGSIKSNNTASCIDIAKLEYCVDFYYKGKRPGSNVPDVVFTYRAVILHVPDARSKHDFVAAGMLVSCLFMMLVLLVYSVLPRLRNIVGMVLMAYLLTLIFAYIMKAVQLIALTASSIDAEKCRVMSPVVFYFIIASFFWLNIMSFDLWWTIRGSRKRRDIHRQGELVKFLWYSLYGWGVPALLTLTYVAIDRYKLYKDSDYKPPFDSCFVDKTPTTMYVHVPIGTMTAANCVLFLMTAYNVWLVKRAINNIKDADNTKNSENRFIIYIKLSIMMGVSWLLELVPDMSLVPFVIVNFYNVFIGVAIFFMFVCKRDIITMLCKRFHIKNKFVDKLHASQHSRSETTKSSVSRIGSKTQKNYDVDNEATELTLYSTT